MKNLIIILFIIALSSTAYSKAVVSLDDAMTLSKEQNKPVLIDIFADWWFPCWKFGRASNNDEEVKNIIEDVVLMKVNKKEAEAEKIIKKYGEPRGFPTFYLVNSDGSLRDSWSGYSKTFFLNKVEKLLNLQN